MPAARLRGWLARNLDERGRVALLVAAAFSMENLDGTVIATALPQMAHSMGVHPVDLHIGITAYLLALAIFIPISGWVADRVGARTVFATAIGVFTVASAACGISRGVGAFTAARVVQGIGGAMMVPVGRVVVLRGAQKRDIMRLVATITWPGLLAPIIGPPLGGFITTFASWRWIFFLNVPLGIAGLVLALRMLPRAREGAARAFDLPGFLLSGAACVLLMDALEAFSRGESRWERPAVTAGLAALLGTAAVMHARRTPHPLLALSTMGIPTYRVSLWGGSLFRLAVGAMPFLLPLLFQVGFGLSPVDSGILVLVVFAGNLAMKPATTPLLRRHGFRRVLIVNGIVTAATIAACGWLTPHTPRWVVAVLLFAGGMGRSMQFTGMTTLGFSDVPDDLMSGASTLVSMAQQLMMGLGVAVGAIALRVASRLRPDSGGVVGLADFRTAFVVVGLFAALGVVDCLTIAPDAGAEVSGHRPPREPRR